MLGLVKRHENQQLMLSKPALLFCLCLCAVEYQNGKYMGLGETAADN